MYIFIFFELKAPDKSPIETQKLLPDRIPGGITIFDLNSARDIVFEDLCKRP